MPRKRSSHALTRNQCQNTSRVKYNNQRGASCLHSPGPDACKRIGAGLRHFHPLHRFQPTCTHADHKDVPRKLGMQMRRCFIPVRAGTIWIVGRVTEISHPPRVYVATVARCLVFRSSRIHLISDTKFTFLSLTRKTSCVEFRAADFSIAEFD